MKSLKTFILAAVAVVAGLFAACSDDDFKAGPAASGAQVYFPESIATEYNIGDDVSELVIPVMRVVDTEAQTVEILAEDESALFTIPTSVSFAAGENKAELLITFDRTKLEDGVEYPIQFLVNDEENTTPYGNKILSISITPWPWELLGTGLFRDDWLSTMWNGNEVEIEVQIHKHKSREGVYMIEEMYGWPFLTEYFGGSQAAIESNYLLSYTPTNITLDASDPNAVIIPRQTSGIVDGDPDYGAYEIATFTNGAGTLENGIVTFPVQGLAFVCTYGTYYANTKGNFRIMLPGAEIVDYSLVVEYDSMRVDADGATSAVLTFNYGADATGIGYVVVAGNISSEERETLAAAIADGTAENLNKIENLDGTGSVTEQFALEGSGAFTVVAVVNDKNGESRAADFVSINFYFPGSGGGSAPECEAEVQLGLPSVLAAEYASQYPDESSLAYTIKGSELQSVRTYLNKTSVIESAPSMGLTQEDLVDNYGRDMTAAQLESVNGAGYLNIYYDLESETSYTLIVKATNVYGKSKLLTAECSTAKIDYQGELVIGDYKMSYTATADGQEPQTFENLFTVKAASSDSVVDFLVTDFAFEDGGSWTAKYDSAASTLTLTSDELGGWYLLNETTAYTIGAYEAGTDTEASSVVLTVDAGTKQLSATQTDIEVVLGSVSGNSITGILGALSVYYADGTTIAPYTAPEAGTSSLLSKVLHAKPAVKVPYRSVADMRLAGRRNLLKSNAAVLNAGLKCPVRTLSVKPERCEPSPKIFGRVGTFKLADNALLAK